MYSFLSQISNFLSQPFLNMANSMTEIPILSAFLLGIVGAMAPCQITSNLGVSQDFVENIFSVHYGCCQSLVSEPFSGIDIVSAFGLSSLILK
ncbi:hypothetical protein LH47_02582 [Anoxybacillus thermarum]|uniref:Uncharacterized protein n=1 Tax=Anoxybacillus thermarum TaxID=404937 RepID=A0A0D0Q5T8_9BACL|nr:hypothetical protein LH47_02582 [Anoxybacillus thermarum]